MNAESGNLDEPKLVPPVGRASACPVSSPYRKHPVHLPPLGDYGRAIIIFVTVCTAQRRKILASPRAHEAIVEAWQFANGWLVGRYVILPDHLHFFCAPNEFDGPSLERWMSYWKSIVTRNLGEAGSSLWQRHFWDRQLRRTESYDEKWEYVRTNPVRYELVSEAAAWPYQGELNELRW
jgi:REP-associated tyrosine transposase